tara:strand:- start:285 stop:803 length:519 start_codon:yes stop_codon:yes gene_type:complete
MKKVYYTWQQIEFLLHEVMRSIKDWKPDYVVGIVRGGCFPAGLYSHYTGVPMYALKVQLADGVGEHTEDNTECNTWMSEDAYNGKNILVFDDINDSGSTFNWIKRDWRQGSFPADPKWQNDMIFGNNVRTACLIDNGPSDFNCDYSGTTINKVDDPCWIVFPWEEWWNPNSN